MGEGGEALIYCRVVIECTSGYVCGGKRHFAELGRNIVDLRETLIASSTAFNYFIFCNDNFYDYESVRNAIRGNERFLMNDICCDTPAMFEDNLSL